jgi:hypothetical protein
MRQLVAALLVSAAATAAARAQQVTFLDPPVAPAAPTANQPVSARVHVIACADIPIAVERTGTVIALRYVEDNCPIIPIPTNESVALGPLPAGTYELRIFEVGDTAHPRLDDAAIFTVAPAPCEGLCLLGGRFTVTAEWTTRDGATGVGHPVPLGDATGAFWFFEDENLEVMVKMLDACSYNQQHWFFAAGLTDVRVVLHVRDELTGAEQTYENPQRTPFQPLQDTAAFGCS